MNECTAKNKVDTYFFLICNAVLFDEILIGFDIFKLTKPARVEKNIKFSIHWKKKKKTNKTFQIVLISISSLYTVD